MKHEEFKKGNLAIRKSDIKKKSKWYWRDYYQDDDESDEDYDEEEEYEETNKSKDGKEPEYCQFGMMNAIHLLFVQGNVVNTLLFNFLLK